MDPRISSDLIRGHTDTIILLLLKKRDMYGYEISKEIFDKSGKTYELKEATLYSSFRRLEKEEYIKSYWGDETQGGRRRYYAITDKGHQLCLENIQAWTYAKDIIDKLLRED